MDSKINEKTEIRQPLETLESEIKMYSEELPYWGKYLAEKILSGNDITEEHINESYSFLLEDLKLIEKSERPGINICFNDANSSDYKNDLTFEKIEKVEGVNALIEEQTIEFGPNLTIIYGSNGSGKSGYVRLLKNAFYAKVPENILPNIHIQNGHKPIGAEFTFKSNDTVIPLTYPIKKDCAEFKQFAVFDSKGLYKQLAEKNEFEFRPAGLSFFDEYTKAVNRIELKLNDEIEAKKSGYTLEDLSDLFNGDSEIKNAVNSLNAKTNIDDIKKYIPFTDADKLEREKLQKQYDDLLLAYKGKEKELSRLEAIKNQLVANRTNIVALNKKFEEKSLVIIKDAINDCISKVSIAKAEGIENFNTHKISGVGTEEWKDFILAADTFAKKQKSINNTYPEKDDSCLLCLQPLTNDAEELIKNYWKFIRSKAEENSKNAQETLLKIKQEYENLNFDLFPENNILTLWLTELYHKEYSELKKGLDKQKELAGFIVSDIQNKAGNDRSELIISTSYHDIIENKIEETIISIKNDEQSKELDILNRKKVLLEHKEKFNNHFPKFKVFVDNQIWLKKAEKANIAKRKITEKEKYLSGKYFNQKYIDIFNNECEKLNGNFGIDIIHTGSGGKSYKQLKLKGKSPNSVLSEGEQKIIAIADFMAEMQLSEINKGVIFDDPVNSLDEKRKSQIAERLSNESKQKQVIIFTHDLVFVSSLIGYCNDYSIDIKCHWIENVDGKQPGKIWLNNTPSFEKEYRKSGKAQGYYEEAKKLPPGIREDKIKNGFAALRTSYEALVVFGLFNGVVQRFEERVSVDSLKEVVFNSELKDKILDSYYKCCRYMEGHSHSDSYSYKKPNVENLNEEIQRFNALNKEINDTKKDLRKPS